MVKCICLNFFLVVIAFTHPTVFSQRLLDDEPINPYVQPIQKVELLLKKEFKTPDALAGWAAWSGIGTFEVQKNVLFIESTDNDPFFQSPPFPDGITGKIRLTIRMRSKIGNFGQIFWTTKDNRDWIGERAPGFEVINDNKFHDYMIPFTIENDELLRVRIDPGTEKGIVEIESVTVEREVDFPIELKKAVLKSDGKENQLELVIKNHSSENQALTAGVFDPFDLDHPIMKSFNGDSEVTHTMTWENDSPFVFRVLSVKYDQQQEPRYLQRALCAIAPHPDPKGVVIGNDSLSLQFDKQFLGAVVRKNGKVVGTIFPLIYYDDSLTVYESPEAPKQQKTPPGIPFFRSKSKSESQIELLATKVPASLKFRVTDDEIRFEYKGARPVHGPVFRPTGRLEQGLLSGVEYLGKGEKSSSKNDIETEERIRYSPNPFHVTMPLTAFVTDQSSWAMFWDNPQTNVIFATPDFITNASEHRMNLYGQNFSGIVRVAGNFETPGGRLEDIILWAVQKRGLPHLPKVPRSSAQQHALNLKGLTESACYVKGKGWKHAFVSGHPELFLPGFSADMISTIWQITGEIPDHGNNELGMNGAHLPNHCIYFMENRAKQWLDTINATANSIRKQQKPDGSFRYTGKYTRGHNEDTASGYCGNLACQLMLHYRMTGNTESLSSALEALRYMKRFRVPSGAQTWELSLHTPDIMGAAWCSLAHTYAYEATGKTEYLELARRWALTGLPFVYQWSNYPVMLYATIPVFGATNGTAPNWIGLPVQWCGLDYGEALFELAKHDQTLDWKKIAEGILISAEQQQYVTGESVGLLPDSFSLKHQRRSQPDITPVVLEQQRRRLEGAAPAHSLAIGENHRVLSPYPVTVNGRKATIEAKAGTTYQVIVDGTIRTIESQGMDVLDL